MTAEVARRSAAGLGAPGWVEYRRKMMEAAQDVADAVIAYLTAGDEDGPRAAAAAQAIAAFQEQGAVARQLDVGEAVIEAERARAVAEDRAAWPRRLRAVT
jgi:hypothetical protein